MQCNAMMVRLFSFWYVLIRTMNACKFSRFSFRATFCHVSLYAKEPLYPYCKICITLFTGTLRSLLSVNKSYYFQSLVKQQTASIQGLVLFFLTSSTRMPTQKLQKGMSRTIAMFKNHHGIWPIGGIMVFWSALVLYAVEHNIIE